MTVTPKPRKQLARVAGKIGRPTRYTRELGEEICALLMEGYSLRGICEREGMPALSAICLWLAKDAGFMEQYARAREVQAEVMADEILEIADDATNDYVERATKNGAVVLVDHDHINRSRLRVDARKWIAEKLLPKKYGVKKALEHSGPTGPDGKPLDMKPVFNIHFKGRYDPCGECGKKHDGPCSPRGEAQSGEREVQQ